MIVVKVPDPAIRGKAMGTMLPERVSVSCLKNSMFRTSSIPSRNMMMDPAIANELTSIPITVKSLSPNNRNAIISNPATMVAIPD